MIKLTHYIHHAHHHTHPHDAQARHTTYTTHIQLEVRRPQDAHLNLDVEQTRVLRAGENKSLGATPEKTIPTGIELGRAARQRRGLPSSSFSTFRQTIKNPLSE
jgi:hypothetical protein